MAYITVESDTASLNVELLPDGRVRHGDAVFTLDELRRGEWRVAADGRAIRAWENGAKTLGFCPFTRRSSGDSQKIVS